MDTAVPLKVKKVNLGAHGFNVKTMSCEIKHCTFFNAGF